MEYKSTDIAKFLIASAVSRGFVMNVTKVQKLLFITDGIYLAIHGVKLVDERPEAWPFGPVFPKTRKMIVSGQYEFGSAYIGDSAFDKFKQDRELVSTIDLTLRTFGQWTAGQLTEWSHKDGSPWYYTTQRDGFHWGEVIPDTYISTFFKNILKPKDNGTKQ